LKILCANGLISEFDLQFSEALARVIASKDANVLDGFRVIATLVSHSSFTKQEACIDVESIDIERIFPEQEDENSSTHQRDAETGKPETIIMAKKVLLNVLNEKHRSLMDGLSKDFPEIIHRTDNFDGEVPFVPLIWNAPRLYLHRFWIYEKELAEILVSRTEVPDNHVIPEHEIRKLSSYFGKDKSADDGQWKAVQLAMMKRFSVVTGGPGTGKTTIVSAILSKTLKENLLTRISLCAPTGKAQARMLESIREEVQTSLLCETDIKSRISELPASTIHRLLKYNHHTGKFGKNAESLLETDTLIVDEASMVSLPMMVRLLRAVPKEAKIILLGDADQLASVETGAVLSDICELSRQNGSKWKHNVAKLTVSHRFKEGGAIDIMKEAINRGAEDDVINQLSTANGESLSWGLANGKRLPSNLDELKDALKTQVELWNTGFMKAKNIDSAIKQFKDFQVLCSHRGGLFGTNSLNKLIRKALGKTKSYEKGVQVMITRNNYEHRLFNGDVGLCWPDDNGTMKVYFPDPEQPGELRKFSPSILPEHEDAFAMTVHKAQGSGFGKVLLVLPDSKKSPILTRELLYTGVTRTRDKVTIWATENTLRAAIGRKTIRSSGLKERLSLNRGEA
jgi:exodeoxyribonuclease V alpha subunit